MASQEAETARTALESRVDEIDKETAQYVEEMKLLHDRLTNLKTKNTRLSEERRTLMDALETLKGV
jgi:prefoldin subunit 5